MARHCSHSLRDFETQSDDSTLYYFLLYMYDQRLYCLVTELLDGRMYQQSMAQIRLCEWAWQSGLHFLHTFHIFS